MRIGYDKYGILRMYHENENEFEIMKMIRKEVFGNGNNLIDLIYSYEYKNGIILAYSNETELIMIIEKMKDDRIERLLQLRNEDEYIRLAARMMLELWG